MNTEQGDIKSIKLSLPYVTEEGKFTLREMTVSFKKAIEAEKPTYNRNFCPTYKMGMSLVIPDHIHKRLVGSFIGRKRELADKSGYTYPKDFPKTITSESLSAITERYRTVIWDYQWLIGIESMEIKKVIFYNFDGDHGENNASIWDGKKMGNDSEISYSYMIGYMSKDGATRFNIDKRIIMDRDGDEVKWKYVDHSDERELFFSTVFAKFGLLLKQLNDFEEKINEKSIDRIIQSNPIKLLN